MEPHICLIAIPFGTICSVLIPEREFLQWPSLVKRGTELSTAVPPTLKLLAFPNDSTVERVPNLA